MAKQLYLYTILEEVTRTPKDEIGMLTLSSQVNRERLSDLR